MFSRRILDFAELEAYRPVVISTYLDQGVCISTDSIFLDAVL